jgi:hypothetical protein
MTWVGYRSASTSHALSPVSRANKFRRSRPWGLRPGFTLPPAPQADLFRGSSLTVREGVAVTLAPSLTVGLLPRTPLA